MLYLKQHKANPPANVLGALYGCELYRIISLLSVDRYAANFRQYHIVSSAAFIFSQVTAVQATTEKDMERNCLPGPAGVCDSRGRLLWTRRSPVLSSVSWINEQSVACTETA